METCTTVLAMPVVVQVGHLHGHARGRLWLHIAAVAAAELLFQPVNRGEQFVACGLVLKLQPVLKAFHLLPQSFEFLVIYRKPTGRWPPHPCGDAA